MTDLAVQTDLRTELLEMPVEDFKAVVNQALRKQTSPEMNAALRSPEVVERFSSQLQIALRSVKGQLAANQADFNQNVARLTAKGASGKTDLLKVQQDFEKWRASTLRFKTGLEQALIEVRSLVEGTRVGMFESLAAQERNWALDKAKRLEEAIRKHRDSLDPNDAYEADIELWALVDAG